jgi:hypothetical protein
VLQKLICFLQARGVPCGYDYSFDYGFGPYSEELAGDLKYTEALGVISFVPRPDLPAAFAVLPGRHEKEVRKRGKDFLDRYRKQIEKVIRDFRDRSARELDLLGGIYFCYRFALDRGWLLSREGLADQVKGLRPRLPDGEIEAAVDWLAQKGYLGLPCTLEGALNCEEQKEDHMSNLR